MPPFEEATLEENEHYVIYRHSNGIVTKVLKEGTTGGMRSSMDTYLKFPVRDLDDFHNLKQGYNPTHQGRYPPMWKKSMLPRWKERQHVLAGCELLHAGVLLARPRMDGHGGGQLRLV